MDLDFSSIFDYLSDLIIEIWNSLDSIYTRLAAIVAFITICTFICRGFYKIFQKLINKLETKKKLETWRNNEILKLDEITDDQGLELIKSNFYIPTMGQIEPPHEGENTVSVHRFPLLDKIINEFLDKDITLDKKRYFLLGGSGMGKSTFLSALSYKFIFKYSTPESSNKLFIKSLGNSNVIQELESLNNTKEAKTSMLLLDALDENIEANNDVNDFRKKLESKTDNFKVVLITCRTQLFEDSDSEPKILDTKKKGGNKRTIPYETIYISPLNDKEVRKYLKRKFGLNLIAYHKANKILKKCGNVLSRPMLLSFIDELMKQQNIDELTLVEIYSKVIDNWFDHEIETNDIRKEELYSFSKKIALLIHNKWKVSESVVISKDEYERFIKDNGFEKSPYSFKARSLINRKSDGSIKFSHRSIWEFFLAIASFEEPGISYTKNGLSMAEEFFKDLCSLHSKGKGIENVHLNETRLACVKPIIQEKLFINSLKEIKLYHNPPLNLNDFNLIRCHRILIELLDSSLNIICNIVNSDLIIRSSQSVQTAIDKYLLENSLLESEEYASSLSETVQDFLSINDIASLIGILKNIIDVKTIDKIIGEAAVVKNAKLIPSDKDNYNVINSFYCDLEETRIPIIGSGFNIIHWIQEHKMSINGKPIIVLKDSEDIDELVNFIDEFKSINFTIRVILNIKFKASTYIAINYYIDKNTNLFDRQKIKSILSNAINATVVDVNKFSWLN